ncbi:hypothetical protein L2E82_16571 [Cichorium intybus]|uniref:Uncharacterized protein n=1 Tax=Cichorium intybus TaxID=13427 RepID=A0ACB9F594_CICIN|nr:hypothetical protein L2E82_16571 [Cichorium intybus]
MLNSLQVGVLNATWKQKDKLEEFQLPSDIFDALSQRTVPFGYGFMQFLDTAVAAEICEELFAPIPPPSEVALNGVEVFMNASGSHHQLRKLDIRIRAFIGATHTRGCVYMYSNHQGCDGGRLYYDGCACVVVNGDVVAQGSQFSLKDVEVVVTQIDLDAVGSLRGSISSFQEQASCKRFVSFVDVPYKLCQPFNLQMSLSSPLKEFAKRVFYTVFMGSENSSDATRSRSKLLSEEIGSWHLDVSVDIVVSAFLSLFQTLTGKRPRYKVDGGSNIENLGLQNIQARIRMVLAFMLASLLPWVHNKPGFYLVLGSSNVDEGLRGYLTKYDCSSADINPIGSISKQDLWIFLRWAATYLGFSSLAEIEAAPPTAELEPIRSNYSQLDEVDMGMTYEELSVYGRLRKIFRCGPVSMFKNLCFGWGSKLSPSEVAEKVKHFFKYYSINRHKMTINGKCSKKGSGKGFHPGKASRPGGRRPE